MRAIDIYSIAAKTDFTIVADGIMSAITEAEARAAAQDGTLQELERLGAMGDFIIGLDRLEAWAAAQWRRYNGDARAAARRDGDITLSG